LYKVQGIFLMDQIRDITSRLDGWMLPFDEYFMVSTLCEAVDPSVLAFSLSSHRHSYISLLFKSHFIA
jgi:hypothetical protein